LQEVRKSQDFRAAKKAMRFACGKAGTGIKWQKRVLQTHFYPKKSICEKAKETYFALHL
jgi:hypothetical protein